MNPPAPPMEISLDPIIYFYTHSLLIIAVSAVVFMAMGIWIGHLTWAKFMRRARAYQEECDLLRHEIAALKRRIGEEAAPPAHLVLINEDAPVPKETDTGPELPGFTLPVPKPEEQTIASALPPMFPLADPQPVITEETSLTAKVETRHESLASVVIGPVGAAHHTLEPVAPPDSIADFAMSAAVPHEEPAKPRRGKSASNGTATPVAGEGLTEAKDPKSVPAPDPSPPMAHDAQTAFAAELADGTAVTDPTLGVLLRCQPERWDDLTLLRGVGEVLQQRLHENGVHTFKQIAYWTETNVEAFSSKIEARDRIQREHWVSQARDMHYLKYGVKLG